MCVCVWREREREKEKIDFGESDKMIKTNGKMDKSNTYSGFSSNTSFFFNRTSSDWCSSSVNKERNITSNLIVIFWFIHFSTYFWHIYIYIYIYIYTHISSANSTQLSDSPSLSLSLYLTFSLSLSLFIYIYIYILWTYHPLLQEGLLNCIQCPHREIPLLVT